MCLDRSRGWQWRVYLSPETCTWRDKRKGTPIFFAAPCRMQTAWPPRLPAQRLPSKGAGRETGGPHGLSPTKAHCRVFALRSTGPHRGQLQRWDPNLGSLVPKPALFSPALIILQACTSVLGITLTLMGGIATHGIWHRPYRISTESCQP